MKQWLGAALFGVVATIAACGSSSGGTDGTPGGATTGTDPADASPGDAHGGDAAPPPPPPPPPADAGHACALGISIPRKTFLDASIAYLRTTFGVADGFDGGNVAYGEMWVSLDDTPCPIADWTSLSYVVAIDPARVPIELRPTHGFVAAIWTLHGDRAIAFVPTAAISATDASPWQQGALPDNVNAIASETAADNAITTLDASVSAAHPTVKVDYLSAIRIVTLVTKLGEFVDDAPAGTFPQINAAADQLRQSHLFSTLEWSGANFRIPSDTWPASVQPDDVLEPECLRTETKGRRDAGDFATSPSLAPPLGPGPIPNPSMCPAAP